jgi:lysophospholipase L1-like esterase
LHLELKKMFPDAVINVVITAIGGESSKSGAKRFKRDVLSLRPDIVVIDYSLNDRGIGLVKARKAWVSMIENAQNYGAEVILLTPTPDLRDNFADLADPLHLHAEQVRQLSKEYGVALVDSTQVFTNLAREGVDLQSLMAYFNHPNRAGHALIAAELLKWFQPCNEP